MPESTRLERAMAVFLAAQEHGVPRQDLLGAHPEIADLLIALFGDEEAAPPTERQLGDFRLLREVGRGGMGVVFEAQQLSLGRRVAVKVLAPERTGPLAIARFRREAQVLARLDHPAIIKVLDVGETDGVWWLAMEFIDGKTLEERLSAVRAAGGHRGASLRELVQIIAAIADALQHVHDAGILHRDLKPSNILLRADGQALLSDFGLARDEAAPTVTQVGVIAGTPHYMSPEHLAGGKALTPQSDVFALGTTLYECLTLQRPFDGETSEAVLQRILTHDPPDPRRLHRGLSRDLAAIALRAIEKDQARRYASAQAFADDLRAFLELRPVAARPPSTVRRLRGWARREPARAALALVLVVAGLLGGLLVTQLPAIRAAAVAQRETAYEEALVEGDVAQQGQDRARSLAAYARARALFPDRVEAEVFEIMTIGQFDGGTAGHDTLCARYPTDTGRGEIERLRALVLWQSKLADRATARFVTLAAPTTPLEMLLHSACLLYRGGPGDDARARDLVSLAVRTSPRPRLFYYVCWAGVAAEHERRECAEALLRLWPDNAVALQQAALCLRDLDPPRATELQKRSVALPSWQGTRRWFFLASFAHRSGDVATAVAAARTSFAEDAIPDDLRAKLIRTVLAVHAPAEATAQAMAWLQRDPKSTTAMALRAEQLAAAGDFDGAVELLELALERRPDDADLRAQLAAMWLKNGERGLAIAEATTVLARHPGCAAAHEVRVAAQRENGDLAAVLAEMERWVGVRPEDAAAWKNLARVLLAQGAAWPDGPARGLAAASRADWLAGGEDAEALELRAQAHAALGEAAAAALCRRRAAMLADRR
ncbi:MAG: protein kinase [Planctomycetes bacterium]|nr:protein kinase [Planctomycetota bacterium]